MEKHRTFGFVTFILKGLIDLACFVMFIISAMNLSGSLDKDYIETTFVASIISIMISALACGVSILAIYLIYKKKGSANLLSNLAIASLAAAALFFHIFVAITIAQSRSDSHVSIDPAAYGFSVCTALSSLVLIAACLINNKNFIIVKKGAALSGNLLLITAAVIMAVVAGGSAPFLFAILIVMICLISAYVLLAKDGEVKEVVEVEGKQIERKVVEIDPIVELEKLKGLFDDGIITEEEYKQKREKYIDLL